MTDIVIENHDNVDMSIVLVCWNNKDYLQPCLESLYEADLNSSFNVVVVDNGSTDGSQEMLRTNYPEIALIQNQGNVGLAKACNQGIEASRGRHVLLLNNDTIVNASSLERMVRFMDNTPEAAAVGGRLLNPDGSLQATYGDFSSLGQEFLIATRLGEYLHPGYPAHSDDSQVKKVDWLSSACLLLRREALDQVGPLDEEYFIYGDEADLQYRLKKAGWEVYYLPDVTTIHYGGRSMDRWRRRKMVYRGKVLFFKKNYGGPATTALRFLLTMLSLGKLAIWSTLSLVPGHRERASKELRSNIDVVKMCWDPAIQTPS